MAPCSGFKNSPSAPFPQRVPIDGERLRVAGRGAAGIGKGPQRLISISHSSQPHRTVQGRRPRISYLEVRSRLEGRAGGDIEVPSLDVALTLNVKTGNAGWADLAPGPAKACRHGSKVSGTYTAVLQIAHPSLAQRSGAELYQELGETLPQLTSQRLHLQERSTRRPIATGWKRSLADLRTTTTDRALMKLLAASGWFTTTSSRLVAIGCGSTPWNRFTWTFPGPHLHQGPPGCPLLPPTISASTSGHGPWR